MRRRILMTKKSGNPYPSKTSALDVLFTKLDGTNKAFFKEAEWPDENEYIPIGIVVVPGIHNRYKDYTCGIMSLKFMSLNDPENGQFAYDVVSRMCTTQPASVSNGASKPFFYANSGSTDNRPDDVSFIRQIDETSEKVKWFPTSNTKRFPYNVNSSTSALTTSSSTITVDMTKINGYGASDFNGIRNTSYMYLAKSGSTVWNETGSIANHTSGAPAYQTCARYKTIGTKAFIDVYSGVTSQNINYGTNTSPITNRGFWYLPSAGELTYIPPIVCSINTIFYKLNQKYGDVAALFEGIDEPANYQPYQIWSSTISTAGISYSIQLNMYRPGLNDIYMTAKSMVRAFMRL